MRLDHVGNYTKGWWIGDFEPSLLRTQAFEVAHHKNPQGYCAVPHVHKVATEYNYIVRGLVNVQGHVLGAGNIFIFDPGEACTDVYFIEATDLIIIKTPSIPGDKYEVTK